MYPGFGKLNPGPICGCNHCVQSTHPPTTSVSGHFVYIPNKDRIHKNSYILPDVWIHRSPGIWIHTDEWIHRSLGIWIHMDEWIHRSPGIWILTFQCMNSYLAASAQRKLRAHSASREGEARAHLLPQPGRARLPRPLGLRLAAPTS